VRIPARSPPRALVYDLGAFARLEKVTDGLFEGEEAVLRVMGWGGGRRGCAGTRTRGSGRALRCWQGRELTPEEIPEQYDFFRAWIEKVVVSPARRRGRPRQGHPVRRAGPGSDRMAVALSAGSDIYRESVILTG
jgi:hypothetical protein